MIVGIDEVGRGPWAGPLVVGAVVLGDTRIEGLTDSKKLTKPRREELSRQIIEKAEAFGIGWIDAAELDEVGLSEALRLATRRALEQITVPYHEIIIDGTVNFLEGTTKGQYVTTMKKADLLIGAVSAASIIAKVARDDHMEQMSELYSGYGFETHVGYGTAGHRAAIAASGVTPLHRRSFAPIKKILGDPGTVHRSIEGTNKQSGNDAEDAVATWMKTQGYEIVERNWRTKFCEVDIIAERSGTLYFVEVKHRRSAGQGGGTAAITPRKLRQMRFAATMYLSRQPTKDARLVSVATTGATPNIVVGDLLFVD